MMALGDGREAQVGVDPGRDLELATVLEGSNPLGIELAKGTLQDAGIPFFVQGFEVGMEALSPLLHPLCRIQVGQDREAEDRALPRVLEEADASGDIGEQWRPDASRRDS
jgi:hypothetical protein